MADSYNIPAGTKVNSLNPKNSISNSSSSTSSNKSSSRSKSKTIVIYDSTGKVTQSNDPNRPVGMVDTSKAKESVMKDVPINDKPTSTVFKRDGSTITKQTFQEGRMVSSEVVQSNTTPTSQRKTTSQLAKEQSSMNRTMQFKAYEQKEKVAAERRNKEYLLAQQKWETGGTLTSSDLFSLQSGGAKMIRFGAPGQKENITKDLSEREAFFKPKKEKLYSEVPVTIKDFQDSGYLKQSIKLGSEEQVLNQLTYGVIGSSIKKELQLKKIDDTQNKNIYNTPSQRLKGLGKEYLNQSKEFISSLASGASKIITTVPKGVVRAFELESGISPFKSSVDVYKNRAGTEFDVLLKKDTPLSPLLFSKDRIVTSTKSGLLKAPTINVKGSDYLTPITSDKDVKTLGITGGVIGASLLAPYVFGTAAAGTLTNLGVLGLTASAIPDAVSFAKNPSTEEGINAGGTALFKATPGIIKASSTTVDLVKGAYIKAGSEFVPPEEVFSPQVLSGDKTLPTSKSIGESLTKFGKSDIVSTASPGKIKGPTVGLGRKGSVGLEDPGIYVTPKGEASPYFTRIAAMDKSSYSYNILQSIKQKFGTPTVTEFTTTGITRLPRSVAKQPGFTQIGEYFKSLKNPTKAFITKRSEIGQGTIKPQTFKAPADFKEGSFNINKGKTLLEAGTSELEAVVPTGATFGYTPKTFLGKIKGFDKYTTFKGKPVAIREATLIGEATPIKSALPTRIFKGTNIASEQSLTSSVLSSVSTSGYVPLISGLTLAASLPKQSVQSKTIISYPVSTLNSSVTSPTSSVTSVTSSPVSNTSIPYSSVSSVVSPTSVPYSTISSQVSSTSSVTSSTSSQVSSTSSGTSGTSSPTSTTTKTPGTPLISVGKSTPKAKKVQGYNVLVKQGGTYVKANEVPLSYGDAISRGGYVTDNSSAATFKVVRTKGGAKTNTQPSSAFSRTKFRSRIIKGKEVKQPNTFIEKNSFRIDSRGELEGITAKGLIAKETKKKQTSFLSDLSFKDITGGSSLRLQPQQRFARTIGMAKLNTANSGTFKLKGSTFKL